MRRMLSISLITMALAAVLPRAVQADVAADAKATRDDIAATLGFVPGFIKSVPDRALPGAWEEMKALQLNPSTAVPNKYKELIGLAVSAQIPCKYCIYAHTEFAKLAGATDVEIGEAVLIGSLTRHWSTVLNGLLLDEAKFPADIAGALEHVKKMMAGKAPAPRPMAVTSYDSAMADIKQSFGAVPEFMAKFPPQALPGAWKVFKQVHLAPDTAIPSKYKSLIGLAVAAQIPCRYCLIADTQFARANGTTDAELSEAVAMAALIRQWSTWLNGTQYSESAFRKEVDTLVKGAKKAQKQASLK